MKDRPAEVFYYPQITRYVHMVCEPGWELPRKKIDFHDLIYIAKGKGEFIVDDIAHDVSAGDMVYIKSGQFRELRSSRKHPLEMDVIIMQLLDLQCKPASLPLSPVNRLEADPKADHLLERIRQYCALREPTSQMLTTAVLMEYMAQVLFKSGLVQGVGSDPRVQKAAAYVMENISRQITAVEISRVVGVHPGYLNKLTIKHTGRTVSRFITSIRVNMAEDAIVYEGISVSEAAKRFGFSDIYHFSKVFKKYKGYPPSTAKNFMC